MAKNSIGGFFVDLGLALDKQSFETGNKYLDGMTNGFNKLIGTARNASVVLATTAIAAGTLSSAELKTATLMGVATEKLDAWKAAASIAGVNVNGLVSSMGKLADVMNHVGLNGQGLSQYSKNLALLGMDVNDLLSLDPADAYQKILETAQAKIKGGMKPTEVYAALQDVIGTEGTNLLTEINRKGLLVADFLNGASATQFMTSEDHENATNFISEVRTITTELKSLSSLFGAETAEALTPIVKDLKEWLLKNGPTIAENIRIIAEKIGQIAEKVAPAAADAVLGGAEVVGGALTGNKDMAVEGFDKIGGAIGFSAAAIRTGTDYGTAKSNFNSRAEITKELKRLWDEKYGDHPYLNQAKRLNFEDLPKELQEAINANGGKKSYGAVKDGIIRPDGTITQVAPDDWVFAARNIGDLAKAFIPQGMAGGVGPGTAQYSIVQNFTINGARDLAQTIRQQAAAGVRDGLQFTMSKAGMNLQQMSGTR